MPEKPTLKPDELREHAIHTYKHQVIRLQDELEKLIKIFAHMRSCFENEMMDGMGYKKLGTTPDLMKKAADLAKLMTSVVEAKIKFDKAQKLLADNMTPEEEEAACLAYIRAMDSAKRKTFLKKLKDWMALRHEWEFDYSKSPGPPGGA